MAIFYAANAPLVNYFFNNFTTTVGGPNLPLAGGKIFFRKDENHLEDANTYSDVSDPNNPVVNPNPLELNDVGAWPFFYADDRLYYIVITGPDGDFNNPIWTLQHINFAGAIGSTGANITNYIPNGQFLAHNVLPADDTHAEGEIRADVTPIAYGNWTFERSTGSTSKDFVTFERYTAWTANPAANPRYALRVQSTAPDINDTFKDIRLTYKNVNSFASDTEKYTVAFSAKDNFSGEIAVKLFLIKNFGTGGSTQTETLLQTFNLTPTESEFYYTFAFGSNLGKTIGDNDDDYVQLVWRLPVNEVLDILFTDALQEQGTIIAPVYPDRTQNQDIAASIGGAFPIPDPLGMDLYLTPQLTADGWHYDDAEIGDMIAESQLSVYVNNLHPSTNRMLANGGQYEYLGRSPLGIPYKRLANKYWDDTKSYYQYGTGLNYLSAKIATITGDANLTIYTNKAGAVTVTADGTPATSFTFNTLYTGNATYNVQGLFLDVGKFFIRNNLFGVRFGTTGAGTSGFTVTDIINSAELRSVIEITPIVATTLSGKYFQFGNTTTQYYVWFTVDGAGADPAPGGTGIEVKLLSTMSATDVGNLVCGAVSGYQNSLIVVTAATPIPAGSYFSIFTALIEYYVWFTKDGVGTDPAPSGKTPIKVELLGTDTAAQVTKKIQVAINRKYFAVPDVRGLFLRSTDDGAGVDPNTDIRYSTNPFIFGDIIGTQQLYEIQSHLHEFTDPAASSPAVGLSAGNDFGPSAAVLTTPTGGNETRAINSSVRRVIKY